MTGSAGAGIARRVCPACGSADPIRDGEAFWPVTWTCPACRRATPVRNGLPLTAAAIADTIDGFDPADFAFLARVEPEHFWFVARRRLLLALVDKYAASAHRLLEIGCGSGNVIAALASRAWSRIVGSDAHPTGLAHARGRVPAQVELVQMDARRLPCRDAFDLVGAFDVLEHIAADEDVIACVSEALVPGGVFIAAVPQHPRLWSIADDVAHHVRRYRRGELERKVTRAGFEILFSTSFVVSLLPLFARSRWRTSRARAERHQDPREVTRQEFNVGPHLNRLLTRILLAETALTRRGLRWPIGASRVVVAVKR